MAASSPLQYKVREHVKNSEVNYHLLWFMSNRQVRFKLLPKHSLILLGYLLGLLHWVATYSSVYLLAPTEKTRFKTLIWPS